MSYITLEELSTEELEIGIKKALTNAEDLIAEGDLLYQHNCFQRAYALYQLAMEEVGKSRLLFSVIMNRKLDNEIDYKEANRDFRHHQTKSQSAMAFEVFALLVMHSSGKESAEERKNNFQQGIDELRDEAEDIEILNDNKNNSLYVGIADKKFVSPDELITKEMASNLKTKAAIRLEAGKTILKGMLQDMDTLISAMKAAESHEKNKIDEHFFDSFFK